VDLPAIYREREKNLKERPHVASVYAYLGAGGVREQKDL
jgi:hypothetical protein